MLCSIIIRSYNEERYIAKLLDGIFKQDLPFGWEIEVIVVDSGSTDSTVSISRHMGAKIILISKDQFSFGRALNLGCLEAKGDIFLFASAHVYPVYKDWINNILEPFNNPKIALVYGRQIGNETTKFSEHQIFDKWFPANSDYNQFHPFCNNANCAIRSSLWKIQPYDEYLTGLEDLDWAQRIINKGYWIVYEASALIVHIHEETYAKIENRYRREAIALKQIMPRVHFNFLDFIRLLIFNLFIDFLNAFQKGVLMDELRGIVLFRYRQFKGTYLGHIHKGDISEELKNKFYYPKKISQNHQPQETLRIAQKIKYL
jgi:rhamnosyltransferase